MCGSILQGDENTVIHVWESIAWKGFTKEATEKKFNVIVTGDWNLNNLHNEYEWTKYYEQDIREFGGTDEEASLVIGGEATLWGTRVDETDVITLAWPRGAAVAERLWSKNPETIEEFSQRIGELRCRMLYNNIEAHPVNGPGFCPTKIIRT
uniref:beta-N-acetylhexosaminidase n=1 Tax=Trichobilharzia regenti TaxID=157069 RepID=A0AA85J297_TRIRE|nr:unnamed protein product [Trichobilharzia regenti]